MSVVETNTDIWDDALAQPDLAPYWKMVNYWAKPSAPGGIFDRLRRSGKVTKTDAAEASAEADKGKDKEADADATDADDAPPPLLSAIVTIYRTRRLGHGEKEYAALL